MYNNFLSILVWLDEEIEPMSTIYEKDAQTTRLLQCQMFDVQNRLLRI